MNPEDIIRDAIKSKNRLMRDVEHGRSLQEHAKSVDELIESGASPEEIQAAKDEYVGIAEARDRDARARRERIRAHEEEEAREATYADRQEESSFDEEDEIAEGGDAPDEATTKITVIKKDIPISKEDMEKYKAMGMSPEEAMMEHLSEDVLGDEMGIASDETHQVKKMMRRMLKQRRKNMK